MIEYKIILNNLKIKSVRWGLGIGKCREEYQLQIHVSTIA